jgi:hypothetical protein
MRKYTLRFRALLWLLNRLDMSDLARLYPQWERACLRRKQLNTGLPDNNLPDFNKAQYCPCCKRKFLDTKESISAKEAWNAFCREEIRDESQVKTK